MKVCCDLSVRKIYVDDATDWIEDLSRRVVHSIGAQDACSLSVHLVVTLALNQCRQDHQLCHCLLRPGYRWLLESGGHSMNLRSVKLAGSPSPRHAGFIGLEDSLYGY